MSAPEVVEGIAVKYPATGPAHDRGRPHRFVVIHIDISAGDVTLVPICSYHDQCDKTCVLEPGDGWTEVQKKSFVGYYQINRVGLKAFTSRIQSGELEYLGKIPSDLYEKIRTGVENSPETEGRILKIIAPNKYRK